MYSFENRDFCFETRTLHSHIFVVSHWHCSDHFFIYTEKSSSRWILESFSRTRSNGAKSYRCKFVSREEQLRLQVLIPNIVIDSNSCDRMSFCTREMRKKTASAEEMPRRRTRWRTWRWTRWRTRIILACESH